jgi:hypothetical protein
METLATLVVLPLLARDYKTALTSALAHDAELPGATRVVLEKGVLAYEDPKFYASLGHPVDHYRREALKALFDRYLMDPTLIAPREAETA